MGVENTKNNETKKDVTYTVYTNVFIFICAYA